MNTDINPCATRDHLSEIKKNTVLFICTGNTCRSPMCAALYNDRYAGMTSHAISAGLYADSSPISKNAVQALENIGVRSTYVNDYKNHISHTVTERDLEIADTVVCVTSSHLLSLLMKYPLYASKLTAIPREISDPYGGGIEEYDRCLLDIEKALSEMFEGKTHVS